VIDCVADASVLIKIVVDEPDAKIAAGFLRRKQVGAPGIAVADVANVLRRLVKSRQRTADAARRSLDEVLATTSILPETDEEAHLTLDLAIALDHPAQDCRYLAAAIAAKVPLVTADAGFARKARDAGHKVHAVAELSSFE
jgi:predicted nucleic acid-binding protein